MTTVILTFLLLFFAYPMLLKRFFGLVVFMTLLAAGPGLACQDVPKDPYRLKYFGTKDGLSSRVAYNSIRDTTGMLWSGTTGGLCRINGNGITVFDDFAETFHGPMCRDENGWLYVRNWEYTDSVEVINPATLEVWGKRFNDRSQGVFGGAFQRNEHPFYFAQGSMIRAFVPGGEDRQVHLLGNEVQRGDQLIFVSDTKYILYRSRNRTVEAFDEGGSSISSLPTNLPPAHIYFDKKDCLWVSNEKGTFRRPPGGDFELFLSPLPDGEFINFFAEDERGNMFFGHLDPVLLRITYLEQIIDGVRSPAKWVSEIEDRILTISGEDFREDIRLNTHGGIYALDFSKPMESPFRRFLYQDILPGKFGDLMRGFAADNDGNVYTNKDSRVPYWFRVDSETNTIDTITMLRNDGSVVDHYGCGTNMLNHQGDIYGHSCDLDSIETFLGFVYRYRPADDSWKRWQLPEPSHVVRWVAKGRTEDELLLVTEEKKLHQDGLLYYFYPALDSFALVRTKGPAYGIKGYTKGATYDDQRNCWWIATDLALYRFNIRAEELHSYTITDGRPAFFSDVVVQENGRVVLGTIQNGLQEFNPDTGEFIKIGGTFPKGQEALRAEDFIKLPADDVATLDLAKDNQLLIATFDGLVLHGKEDGETTTFTTADGLNDNEFNTASTFYNPIDQRWYAGGINGFVSFSIGDLALKPSPYNPALVSYRLLDRNKEVESIFLLPSAPTEPVIIAPSVIYFAIEFTMPDYFPRGAQRYQTKLVGLDPGWSAPTTNTSVRYTSLEPGTYTFQVRAFDGEGRKGRVERTLKVIVLTPFYQQWWFILLVIGFALAIFYRMHQVRMARLRLKMEGERKVQSLELRSLRQQLNPHFISNAMNAIKEYIQHPGAEEPERYLTDFSQMMRSFLESSRSRFTSITDEVDMLKRYVNLEQLRFPGKFDVEFFIDSNLDPEMDEVPSLLLQPIIENAIDHGLRPLESGGHLRVSFDLDPKDDDIIICIVSDNGVGRKIAAEHPKSPGHISRATEILEERRALLASDDEIKLGVSVEDLYPELEHTGTVVTIRIEAS